MKFCVGFALFEVVLIKLVCVVVDSVVFVSGYLLCFHCFSLRWVLVGGCGLLFVSIVSSSFKSLQVVSHLRVLCVSLLCNVSTC